MGGQFGRIIGLTKQPLYKATGKAKLTWKQFKSVQLDIEITVNNRPPRYIEDDIHTPILITNLMILGQPNFGLEGDVDNNEDCDLKKRAEYIRSCKGRVWSRWTKEYLRGLREQHNLVHNSKELILMEEDVVITRGELKNREHWKTGIVHQLLPGRDGITRAVKLRPGKSYLERAVQQLYPLELRCDQKITKENNENQLDVNGKEFRSRRNAAAIAAVKMRDQIKNEYAVQTIE